MRLTLQFLSIDEVTQANCDVVEETEEVYVHAAIHTGGNIGGADAAMLNASAWQRYEGRYLRYAGGAFATHPNAKVGSGKCQVYCFPTKGDRDAFCLLTRALPSLYVRAVAQYN